MTADADKRILTPPSGDFSFPERKWREQIGRIKEDILNRAITFLKTVTFSKPPILPAMTNYTPTYGAGGSGSWSATTSWARYLDLGSIVLIDLHAVGATASSPTYLTFTAPTGVNDTYAFMPAQLYDGSWDEGFCRAEGAGSSTIRVYNRTATFIGNFSSTEIRVIGFYVKG